MMKLASWSLTRRKNVSNNFLITPYVATSSLRSHRATSSLIEIFSSLVIFGATSAISLLLINLTLSPLSYLETLLISPLAYLLTEFMGALGQIVFYPFGSKTFPIHSKPYLSLSLSQFWGRRWNLWVQDWLNEIGKTIRHAPPKLRLVGVFLASGMFHELMINLPYWLIYKKSYFGTMLGYFFFQSLFLWFHKHFIFRFSAFWQRAYMFAALMLPSPLFINVPLKSFLGIYP